MKEKRLASLSLDLDNLWSYMKTHGDAEWETFPSYFGIVVPRVLEFLREHNLTITFFIVGQDAAIQENWDAIRAIADAGHEIGNHSFNHEPWLHLYSRGDIEAELTQTEEHIQRITGQRPVGFRGPGYSLSPTVLDVLAQRGYRYDASTLPTFLGPLARAYYFMTTRLNSEQQKTRRQLFGTIKEGFKPVKPYRWKIDNNEKGILEVPVTTMPLFKIPFHVSYVLYLARFSSALAILYFRVAIWLCQLTHTSPSLLLHPLDFLGYDDVDKLSFFPAMDLSGEKKTRLVGKLINIYSKTFNVVPLARHVDALSRGRTLKTMDPALKL